MLQKGHGGDGCNLSSTLCKYYLRKGDFFVQSWTRVRRVKRKYLFTAGMCGGGVRSILLLPLVARFLETIDACIWRMFFICSGDCVGVCGNVFGVAGVVEYSVFSLGVLKYIVCLCKACDGCCMFVSCVHYVAVSMLRYAWLSVC